MDSTKTSWYFDSSIISSWACWTTISAGICCDKSWSMRLCWVSKTLETPNYGSCEKMPWRKTSSLLMKTKGFDSIEWKSFAVKWCNFGIHFVLKLRMNSLPEKRTEPPIFSMIFLQMEMPIVLFFSSILLKSMNSKGNPMPDDLIKISTSRNYSCIFWILKSYLKFLRISSSFVRNFWSSYSCLFYILVISNRVYYPNIFIPTHIWPPIFVYLTEFAKKHVNIWKILFFSPKTYWIN